MWCGHHILKNVEQKGCKLKDSPLEDVFWATRQSYTKEDHERNLAELELSTPGILKWMFSGYLYFLCTSLGT